MLCAGLGYLLEKLDQKTADGKSFRRTGKGAVVAILFYAGLSII